MHYSSKNYGFTQSQTLLILFVVLLVLFVLIFVPFHNSTKRKITVAKLKMVYTMLYQANNKYSINADSLSDYFDTALSPEEFGEEYYIPFLNIEDICSDNQNKCWNEVQYKDLGGRKFSNKAAYSIILKNGAVIGFSKDKNGLMNLIVDIDGKTGKNQLGYDVFVFSFYNNNLIPKLCEDSVYEIYIKDGMHFGGYDKCGIPQDIYDYKELYSKDLADACNKKAPRSLDGIGIGAACSALIFKSNWTIDKIYPW